MPNERRKNMEARKLLIALHAKHKGDWEKIYDSITRKEEIDTGKMEKEANAVISSHGKVLTIMDDDPIMAKFKSKSKPPFVLMLDGSDLMAEAGGGDLVSCDEQCMAETLAAAGIPAAYYEEREDGTKAIVVIKDAKKMSITENDKAPAMMIRLGQIAGKMLFSKLEVGDPHNIMLAEGVASGTEIYALPGRAGSKTNQLIKEGTAHLADCPDDLRSEAGHR